MRNLFELIRIELEANLLPVFYYQDDNDLNQILLENEFTAEHMVSLYEIICDEEGAVCEYSADDFQVASFEYADINFVEIIPPRRNFFKKEIKKIYLMFLKIEDVILLKQYFYVAIEEDKEYLLFVNPRGETKLAGELSKNRTRKEELDSLIRAYKIVSDEGVVERLINKFKKQ